MGAISEFNPLKPVWINGVWYDILDFINEGCERGAFTVISRKDGYTYCLKISKREEDGQITNRFEYILFSKFPELCPKVYGISDCHYYLVTEFLPYEHEFGEPIPISAPLWWRDKHSGNIRYTYDYRPKIIDAACGFSQIESAMHYSGFTPQEEKFVLYGESYEEAKENTA